MILLRRRCPDDGDSTPVCTGISTEDGCAGSVVVQRNCPGVRVDGANDCPPGSAGGLRRGAADRRTDEWTEMHRIKRENRLLREEWDILERTAA